MAMRMKSTDRRLVRHLGIVVLLKLAILAALWWAFARDLPVRVDVENAAAHLGVAPRPIGASQ